MFLLTKEIVDRLPWGIIVIDRDFKVQYTNPRFQEIFDPQAAQQFPMDREKLPVCMGHILGCGYNGSADHLKGRGACRHCEFRIPIDMLSDIVPHAHAPGTPGDKYTVVKEFLIQGQKVLKYLVIQYVALGNGRMMLLVDDQTPDALAKLDVMDDLAAT